MKKFVFFLILGISLVMLFAPIKVHSEEDGEREGERWERFENIFRRKSGGKYRLPPIADNLYKEECSSCHFLYFPGLLPSGSWIRVMDDTGNHFGEDLGLEAGTIKDIREYLVANAADKTGSKISVRVVRSLGRTTPLRITDIPYIIRKHHELSSRVFKREAVGSFANCGVCHITAASEGDFDEHRVRIPR
ncbi:MAG: diheme cytochrome c [Thermodesulfobacteriota bacterium]